MKILYITPQLPYPLISGGRIKTFSTLQTLIKLRHEVILFSFIECDDGRKYIKYLKKIGIKDVIVVYNPAVGERNKLKQIIRIFKSFFTRKPYGVLRYSNKNLQSKINNYLSNNKVDIIWINFLYMAQYLPAKFHGLKIIESHDVESKLYKGGFLKGMYLHLRLLYLYEWIKYSIYEKIIYKNFNIIFSISENDKSLLGKITKRNDIIVLPPAIELKEIENIEREPNTLIFTGALFWYVNKDGFTWFIKRIYPIIKKSIPLLKLWVIGRYTANFKVPKLEGLKLLGFVKDTAPYMNKAQIFISPIKYGTGLRIKILEAMSYRIPIVTTVDGANGLSVTDGKELLIAKNEIEFAERVISLLRDRKLRNKLVKNSNKFLHKNYSFQKEYQLLSALLTQQINNDNP